MGVLGKMASNAAGKVGKNIAKQAGKQALYSGAYAIAHAQEISQNRRKRLRIQAFEKETEKQFKMFPVIADKSNYQNCIFVAADLIAVMLTKDKEVFATLEEKGENILDLTGPDGKLFGSLRIEKSVVQRSHRQPYKHVFTQTITILSWKRRAIGSVKILKSDNEKIQDYITLYYGRRAYPISIGEQTWFYNDIFYASSMNNGGKKGITGEYYVAEFNDMAKTDLYLSCILFLAIHRANMIYKSVSFED